MQFFLSAIAWLFDPQNYAAGTQSPLPIQDRIGEHLFYVFASVAIAAIIALPLGFFIGHTGRGRQFVIGFTGAVRALPTLGLLMALFVVIGNVVPFTQTAFIASFVAFVVLAIPSMLAGAYAGLESVSRETIDAARASGMTEFQILFRVEIPLALPLIISGFRASTLQVISTVTLGAYLGLTGLGPYIFTGLTTRNFPLMLTGAILVTALALVVDAVFAIVQRAVVPRGVVAASGRTPDSPRTSSRPAVSTTP